MQSPKRKTGRPGREPEPGERVGLSLRVTPEMKRALDAAAESSGRSLSQEAEARLERSFQNEELLPQLLQIARGRQLAAVLQIIGYVMKETGNQVGFFEAGTLDGAAGWFDNPNALAQAVAAGHEILSALRPAEGAEAKPLPPGFENIGAWLARGALEAVRNPDRGGAIGEWAAPIRAQMGVAASSRLVFDNSKVMVPAYDPGHGVGGVAVLTKSPEEKS